MLATFASAEVASSTNLEDVWTGCPFSGVRRTPMLVGMTSAQAASDRTCTALLLQLS
jgi:hypothetical protein